jgi:hypothetical protein
MIDLERPDFIQGVGMIAGAASAATLITQPALAQTLPQPGGRPMTYTPKPLPLVHQHPEQGALPAPGT